MKKYNSKVDIRFAPNTLTWNKSFWWKKGKKKKDKALSGTLNGMVPWDPAILE